MTERLDLDEAERLAGRLYSVGWYGDGYDPLYTVQTTIRKLVARLREAERLLGRWMDFDPPCHDPDCDAIGVDFQGRRLPCSCHYDEYGLDDIAAFLEEQP